MCGLQGEVGLALLLSMPIMARMSEALRIWCGASVQISHYLTTPTFILSNIVTLGARACFHADGGGWLAATNSNRHLSPQMHRATKTLPLIVERFHIVGLG